MINAIKISVNNLENHTVVCKNAVLSYFPLDYLFDLIIRKHGRKNTMNITIGVMPRLDISLSYLKSNFSANALNISTHRPP